MKNKKKIIVIVSVVLAMLILSGVIVFAASYDSTQDPLVSLSYITNVFKKSIDTDVGAVRDRVTAAEKKVADIEKAIADGTIGGSFDSSGLENRLDALEKADTLTDAELENIKKQLQDSSALTETQLAELNVQLQSARDELAKAKGELEALVGNSATKSELEGEVSALTDAINAQSSKVDTLIETYGALLDALVTERENGDNYGFVTVTLNKGEKAVWTSGASVMLRGGEGTYTFASSAYDATASEDAVSGNGAKAEHIVVFEKDGSFTATSDTATIMIKGEYKIER